MIGDQQADKHSTRLRRARHWEALRSDEAEGEVRVCGYHETSETRPMARLRKEKIEHGASETPISRRLRWSREFSV